MRISNSIYHVSPLKNLSSILNYGFQPSRGPRSKLFGEQTDQVYFFNGREAFEQGLSNWLDNTFDEEEPLIVFKLKSSLIDVPLYVNEQCAYEVIANRCVKSSAITRIEDENEIELVFKRGVHQSLCSFPHHIVNHTEFGIKLENFACDNLDMIANENGCGWTDGGCLIFAKALELWSKQEITLGAAVSVINEKLIVDHAVGICKTENGIIYLDANGLSAKEEMLKNQFTRPCIDIVPFPDSNDEIPENLSLSTHLAEKMSLAFGEFNKSLFPALPAKKTRPSI